MNRIPHLFLQCVLVQDFKKEINVESCSMIEMAMNLARVIVRLTGRMCVWCCDVGTEKRKREKRANQAQITKQITKTG